jgi:hypothetical protein
MKGGGGALPLPYGLRLLEVVGDALAFPPALPSFETNGFWGGGQGDFELFKKGAGLLL